MQHTHKDLTISYNFLNLPMQIQALNGNMDFLYDATGRKWAKSGPLAPRFTPRRAYPADSTRMVENTDAAHPQRPNPAGVESSSLLA